MKVKRNIVFSSCRQAFPALTPYQYAFNSPISYRDPTGLAPQKEKGDRVLAFRYDTYKASQIMAEAMERMKQEEAEAHANDMARSISELRHSSYSLLCMQEYYGMGMPSGGYDLAIGSSFGRTGRRESGNGSNPWTDEMKAKYAEFAPEIHPEYSNYCVLQADI